jgi:uncharacterized protein
MNKKDIIKKTADHVKSLFLGESSGHDWWHIYRVWKTASTIAKNESNVDSFVIELAALLHDISDHKFNGGDLEAGPRIAREWLLSVGVDSSISEHVAKIVSQISFKVANVSSAMSTKEGAIVQDADRLDAIGAIGIARTFAYGGHKGHEMYDPAIKSQMHDSFESYSSNKSPTINHFYEKLLLLKGLMNTKAAKNIADKRHKYMQDYLERFYNEWEGQG